MPLLRVARATLKADALLVFSWVGNDTAVVRDASTPAWQRAVLTLPHSAMRRAGGALLEVQAPNMLVSTALAATLPFAPAAALAVHSSGDSEEPLGGLLALWANGDDVPSRVTLEPPRACSELGRMADEWLRQASANDRAELLQHVMRCTPDAIVFLPEDGHHAIVNDTAAELLRLPSGTVRGPDVAVRMRDFGHRVLNGAERESMAATIFGRQMDVRNSLWEVGPGDPEYYRVSCFNASHGSLRGRIWTFRDVTQEERALRVLSERKALYRSQHQFLQGVLEAMDDAVVASDADGTLTLINSSARERHGMAADATIDEAADRLFAGVFDPRTGAPLSADAQPLQQALRGEDTTNVPLQALRRDGRRDLLVSARALRNPSGKVTGAVAVERDITERNALEAQMRQNEKLQALGRMAAGVTHDVNNLLTVMQSSITALQSGERDTDGYDEDLQTLAAAIEESRAMTRNLLDFCRGRVRAPKPVNVSAVVERLQGLLRRLASKDVRMEIEYPNDEPLVVMGDAAEMEQVLLNLCTNANDAMPAGGTLQLSVSALELDSPLSRTTCLVPPGDYVRLQVSDTGMGMNPAVLERVFEPFFTTKDAGNGTGLGLATVYGIVDRNGGHVSVQSEVDVGTVFEVYLPRVHREVPVPRPSATIRTREEVAATGHHVLIVDDDNMVRRAVTRMVERLGYTAVPVASADEALVAVTGAVFDVIMSDVQMPAMDGAELVRELRSRGVHTPTVLMSGYAELRDDVLLDIAGVAAFLTKPFSAEEVGVALDRATNGSRLAAVRGTTAKPARDRLAQ